MVEESNPAVITAAVSEGREGDGKTEGSLWIPAETGVRRGIRQCVCCVCGAEGRKADRSRNSEEIGHHGDGRRGRRLKRKQQEGTIVFFFEYFKRKSK